MSELFSYQKVKDNLRSQAYYWEQNFELIERMIIPSDVIITYPKGLFNGDVKEKSIIFFLKNCIYKLIYENGKAYRIVALNPKNIVKMTLDIEGVENATLSLYFPSEDIILSSTDSINKHQDYKYVETLLDIAKLYSS